MNQSKEQPVASQAGERAADLVDRSRDPETWLQFADQVRQQWGAAADTLGDAMCQAGRQIKRTAHAADADTAGTLAASALKTGKRAQAQIAGVVDSLGDTIENTGKLAQTRLDVANAALVGLTEAAGKAGKKRQRRLTRAWNKAAKRAGKSWQRLADALADTLNQTGRQARGRSAHITDSVSSAIGDTIKGTGERAQNQWQTLTGALDDTGKRTGRRARKGQRETRKALGRVMRSLIGARLAAAALPSLLGRRSRWQANARRRANANRSSLAAACLGTAALGAGLMYFYDPDLGAGRRAEMRDRLDHLKASAADALSRGSADLTSRLRGLTGGAGWQTGERVPDHVLADRVRSQLGGVTSHPDSIGITAHQGLITLSGPVLTHEENRVLSRVHSVRGVTGIENRLEIHDQPDGVPGLQSPGAFGDRDSGNWG